MVAYKAQSRTNWKAKFIRKLCLCCSTPPKFWVWSMKLYMNNNKQKTVNKSRIALTISQNMLEKLEVFWPSVFPGYIWRFVMGVHGAFRFFSISEQVLIILPFYFHWLSSPVSIHCLSILSLPVLWVWPIHRSSRCNI